MDYRIVTENDYKGLAMAMANAYSEAIGLEHHVLLRVYYKPLKRRSQGCKRKRALTRRILSLIETAKQNGIASEDYLRCLFEKAPYAETREDWGKLLPWNIEITPYKIRGEWI